MKEGIKYIEVPGIDFDGKPKKFKIIVNERKEVTEGDARDNPEKKARLQNQ